VVVRAETTVCQGRSRGAADTCADTCTGRVDKHNGTINDHFSVNHHSVFGSHAYHLTTHDTGSDRDNHNHNHNNSYHNGCYTHNHNVDRCGAA